MDNQKDTDAQQLEEMMDGRMFQPIKQFIYNLVPWNDPQISSKLHTHLTELKRQTKVPLFRRLIDELLDRMKQQQAPQQQVQQGHVPEGKLLKEQERVRKNKRDNLKMLAGID